MGDRPSKLKSIERARNAWVSRLTQAQHASLSKRLEPYCDPIRAQNLEQKALPADHDVVLPPKSETSRFYQNGLLVSCPSGYMLLCV